jgi:hypothetical protein
MLVMINRFAATMILLISCALPLYAQEIEGTAEADTPATAVESEKRLFHLGGQYRELYTQMRTRTYSQTYDEKYLIADLKRLRLSPELNWDDRLIVHVDYDTELIIGSYLKSLEFDAFWRPTEYNDLVDMSWEPYYSRDLLQRDRIHRAYVKFIAGDFTLTAGRQQIRFGSGRLWNPLDVLNPISPTALEAAEDQKGIDALRVEYYLNDTTEIGAVLEQRRRDDEKLAIRDTGALLRVKTTIVKTEIAALGGRLARRSTGGVDVSAIVLDGTLRGSGLYSHPDDGEPFFTANAGYEYTFAMGLYVLAEYFYNQSGLNFEEDLAGDWLEAQMYGMNDRRYYALANRFLTLNRHYAGLALGYDITALMRADFFTIVDADGRGWFFYPSLKYNLMQNVDIAAGLMACHVFPGAGRLSDFEFLKKSPMFMASLSAWF